MANYIILTEATSSDDSDDYDVVITALVTLLIIAVIGLVISIVINVFVIVKLKQPRCVVTTIHQCTVPIIDCWLQT